MTAKELLNRMLSAGFDLSVSCDGCLVVEQTRWIDDELDNLIKTNINELIELIKAKQ